MPGLTTAKMGKSGASAAAKAAAAGKSSAKKQGAKKKLSKAGKKNMRKNTDIQDLEEFQERMRQEELMGGPFHERANEDLFFLDKGVDKALAAEVIGDDADEDLVGGRKRRKRKLLSYEKALLPNPHVKALTPNKKAGEKKKEILRQKRLAEKPPPPRKAPAPASDPTVVTGEFAADAWAPAPSKKQAEAAAKAKAKQQEEEDVGTQKKKKRPAPRRDFITHTEEREVRRPRSLMRAEAEKRAGVVPSVEVASAGASYNPSYDDHQATLAAAVEQEEERLGALEKARQQLSYSAELAELPAIVHGIDDVKAILTASEAEQSDAEARAAGAGRTTTDGQPRRKTRTQRNRERAQREEELARLAAKSRVAEEQKIDRVGLLKRSLRAEAAEEGVRAERKAEREEAERGLPKQLGRIKYKAPHVDVKLTEELAGSLRELVPEGNLLRDRYKSMQKRNIVEPRKQQVPHRKFALKVYEKHGHKRFDSQDVTYQQRDRRNKQMGIKPKPKRAGKVAITKSARKKVKAKAVAVADD